MDKYETEIYEIDIGRIEAYHEFQLHKMSNKKYTFLQDKRKREKLKNKLNVYNSISCNK